MRSSVTAIQDIGASVYPNPVDDLLYIRVKDGVSASIFDISGRRVKYISLSSQLTSIPVGDMSPGDYVIHITSSSGSGVYKLIKR